MQVARKLRFSLSAPTRMIGQDQPLGAYSREMGMGPLEEKADNVFLRVPRA